NGNSSTNYTVTFGKTATIDVFTKPGYYFTGAYDTDGTKYFDGNGNSTMVWGVGNPDTFYAKFESVSKCSYLEIDLDEEPQSFLFSKVSRYFTLSDELISAIKANLDYNLNVSISFDAACDTTVNQYLSYAYISNLSSGGTNHYCFEEKTLVPKNGVYKNFSYNFTIKAREFKNGKVYFFINHSYDLYDPDVFYVKNIKLKISFANQ
ncbi:MAG: hypothetical protein IJX17_02705, partial [Clostridia bacterium]|nr:hypothetical protein [Clostridia bacterium]